MWERCERCSRRPPQPDGDEPVICRACRSEARVAIAEAAVERWLELIGEPPELPAPLRAMTAEEAAEATRPGRSVLFLDGG